MPRHHGHVGSCGADRYYCILDEDEAGACGGMGTGYRLFRGSVGVFPSWLTRLHNHQGKAAQARNHPPPGNERSRKPERKRVVIEVCQIVFLDEYHLMRAPLVCLFALGK